MRAHLQAQSNALAPLSIPVVRADRSADRGPQEWKAYPLNQGCFLLPGDHDAPTNKEHCLYLFFIQSELMTSESNQRKETISCTPMSVISVLSQGALQKKKKKKKLIKNGTLGY